MDADLFDGSTPKNKYSVQIDADKPQSSNSNDLPFDDILNDNSKKSSAVSFNEEDVFGSAGAIGDDELIDEREESTPWKKWDKTRILILLVSSIPFLLQPLSTSLTVPSFNQIETDFGTNYELVVFTITGFNVMAGIGPLFYGPISDIFGRKIPMYFALPLYAICAALAGFSLNIWMLIFFRSLMGFFACVTVVVGTGIISDTFAPKNQGKALGIQQLPALFAPLFGSALGGAISNLFGWRSINFFLAIISVPIAILVLLIVPETLSKRASQKVTPIGVLKALNPWNTIRLLFHPVIGIVAAARSVGFAMMILLTLMTPTLLLDLYDFDPWQIGLWLIPFGIGALVGSISGGILVDVCARKMGRGGRLFASIVVSIVEAFSLALFGFTIALNPWIPMIFSMLVGFAASANRPGFISYSIAEIPSKAGQITAATMFLSLLMNLPVSTLGPIVGKVIGIPALFSIMGFATIVSLIPATFVMSLNFQFEQKVDPGY